MSNILAILGATGQQGGSIVNFVLNDPELSQKYKIRAITRDVNSEKAKKLKEKVEVVQGNVLDRASLKAALTGVHTVFSVTTPSFGPNALEDEYNTGKAIADIAVESGAQYIIFSTLTAIKDISGGKYTNVFPFDAKAKIEQYIRGLPIKSAFYAGASFMENFQSQPFLAPTKAADGTWVLARHVSAQSKFPLIDAVGDTGKFVGAILAEPDKYEGKTFYGAAAVYTMEQVAAILSKATGKTIVYKQISVKDFKEGIVNFGLPPIVGDIFADGFTFNEEFRSYFKEFYISCSYYFVSACNGVEKSMRFSIFNSLSLKNLSVTQNIEKASERFLWHKQCHRILCTTQPFRLPIIGYIQHVSDAVKLNPPQSNQTL